MSLTILLITALSDNDRLCEVSLYGTADIVYVFVCVLICADKIIAALLTVRIPSFVFFIS